ncbi:MAG: ABC transporter permease [Caldisericales bacterium]|nr:ABC transporter permease [Caldisericales bacterium]
MRNDTFISATFKRLFRHKLALIGFCIIFLLVLVSIFADVMAPNPNQMNLDAALTPPLKELYVARSSEKIPQNKYLYITGPSSQKTLVLMVDVNADEKIKVEFDKTGPALEVMAKNGTKKFVPQNDNILSPGDSVIGESATVSTFRSRKSVILMDYRYRFAILSNLLVPSKEVIGGDLVSVEWVDEGPAFLVRDKKSGQLRLHKEDLSDLSPTEEEIGKMPKPLLGTDNAGRDIAQRLVHGARISLYVGIIVEFICLLIGIPLGAMAGFFGGWLDNLIMRFTDIMFAFPGLLFAIAVMSIFENRDITTIFIALGLVGWPTIARIVRGQVISLKNTEFVEGARAIGCSNLRIITSHIMPNVVAPIVVYTSLGIASAIMSEAGLSFLGIGIRPPTPSWGTMINEGFQHALDAPHIWLMPGIVIALVVLAFNFLGDGLRDALDPKLKI